MIRMTKGTPKKKIERGPVKLKLWIKQLNNRIVFVHRNKLFKTLIAYSNKTLNTLLFKSSHHSMAFTQQN